MHLTYADCLEVLGAVCIRARQDAIYGSPAERADAERFLDWVFGPTWRARGGALPPKRHALTHRPAAPRKPAQFRPYRQST